MRHKDLNLLTDYLPVSVERVLLVYKEIVEYSVCLVVWSFKFPF